MRHYAFSSLKPALIASSYDLVIHVKTFWRNELDKEIAKMNNQFTSLSADMSMLIWELRPWQTALIDDEIRSHFVFQSFDLGNRGNADSFFPYIPVFSSVKRSGIGD